MPIPNESADIVFAVTLSLIPRSALLETASTEQSESINEQCDEMLRLICAPVFVELLYVLGDIEHVGDYESESEVTYEANSLRLTLGFSAEYTGKLLESQYDVVTLVLLAAVNGTLACFDNVRVSSARIATFDYASEHRTERNIEIESE